MKKKDTRKDTPIETMGIKETRCRICGLQVTPGGKCERCGGVRPENGGCPRCGAHLFSGMCGWCSFREEKSLCT